MADDILVVMLYFVATFIRNTVGCVPFLDFLSDHFHLSLRRRHLALIAQNCTAINPMPTSGGAGAILSCPEEE
jgi:hypothetical protein